MVPTGGALTLATVFGLFSIVCGVYALTLAVQMRRLRRAVAGPTDPRVA